MPFTWKEFREGVSQDRFLLPVYFQFNVNYISTIPDPTQITELGSFIISCVMETLRTRKEADLRALSLKYGPSTDRNNEEESASFIQIDFRQPIYAFSIRVGPERILIAKPRANLEDVILTVPILEEICERLFGGRAPKNSSKTQPSLLDEMRIRDSVHGVYFVFDHELHLGTQITAPRVEPTNDRLLEKLVKTAFPGTIAGVNLNHEAPLAALQPESINRGDVHFGFNKTLASRSRSIFIVYEGPYNVTKKYVDLRFQYDCGTVGSRWQEDDLTNWHTPFIEFYRDMMLNRFMPDLFHDVSVHSRI